jgi:hypothetical protein
VALYDLMGFGKEPQAVPPFDLEPTQAGAFGAPNWKLSAEIGIDGQDNNDAACLGASMHAVHAIEPVVNAAPGVRTLLDLPMIVGRGTLGVGVAATPGF